MRAIITKYCAYTFCGVQSNGAHYYHSTHPPSLISPTHPRSFISSYKVHPMHSPTHPRSFISSFKVHPMHFAVLFVSFNSSTAEYFSSVFVRANWPSKQWFFFSLFWTSESLQNDKVINWLQFTKNKIDCQERVYLGTIL